MFMNTFLVEYFYGCKIISLGIGLNQNFFVENFYDCKIISCEIGNNQKFS